MIAEQELWISVLKYAFEDALRNIYTRNKHGETVRIRDFNEVKKAKDYLTTDSESFRFVCGLAGLSPDWVRKKYKQLITGKFTPRDKKRLSDGVDHTD